jgi:hypothetical protein
MSIKARTVKGTKEVTCSVCNKNTMIIDHESVGGTCWRCTSRMVNGRESLILTDLSPEAYKEFINKVIYAGSPN